jgi:hypothetical protein
VRIWLSWSAYRADPERTIRNFQQAVDICGNLDLLVLPVIFNRWTGTPIWDRVEYPEILADFEATFRPYVRDLVLPMRGDLRIFAWDLCNEPLGQGNDVAELFWLTKIRDAIKQIDPGALTCIGTMPSVSHLASCAPLQDILTPHLYYPLYAFPPRTIPAKLEDTRVPFDVVTQSYEVAKRERKPIISTECCWGADDDMERADIIRTNLESLKKYKISFFPHALYTSGVADLHKYKKGLYMPFILLDGSLRPGHDVYNEFTR